LMAINGGSTDATCGNCNGTATVNGSGGTQPYAYLWNNGAVGSTATGLCAGTYTVTVTDKRGCTATTMVVVNGSANLMVCEVKRVHKITCFGGNDGALVVNVANGVAPYTYAWSNGATTQVNMGLTAGHYQVTVTGANGCTSYCKFTICAPDPLICNTTKQDATCNCEGSATVTATGGTAPYTYLWSTGQITASIDKLCAGKYEVTVTDASGCSNMCDVTIVDAALTCNGFMTGHSQSYYNAFKQDGKDIMSNYLDTHFGAAFPNGLVVGCSGGNTITLTNATAVKNFLPSKPNTNALTQSYINPNAASLNNGLAAQLATLTLNVQFDLYDGNLAPNSTVNFKDLVVDSGPLKGLTVEQVLMEGNSALGGCGSKYTRSQIRYAAAMINSSWNLGTKRNNQLTCPKSPCLKNEYNQSNAVARNMFNVYPNPTMGKYTVAFMGIDESAYIIELRDFTGRLISTKAGVSTDGINEVNFDISLLPPAVYTVKLTVKDLGRTIRLVKVY
nr:T9SS type A sorting domain-containing protein [Bacteroidota bacterium]